MFSFLTDKELAKYLDDVFKNKIAKDAFERFEDLDSRNLTDEYLDKTNSGELEDPMNYKSSGLVYTESKDDVYRVFVLMPGVSKDDISITYVENGDSHPRTPVWNVHTNVRKPIYEDFSPKSGPTRKSLRKMDYISQGKNKR